MTASCPSRTPPHATLTPSKERSGRTRGLYGTAEELDLPEVDGFEAELKAFLGACEKGEAPADCRPEDSAEAIRMTLAMRASRERGGEPTAP